MNVCAKQSLNPSIDLSINQSIKHGTDFNPADVALSAVA
jgi:hypothetical protein